MRTRNIHTIRASVARVEGSHRFSSLAAAIVRAAVPAPVERRCGLDRRGERMLVAGL